MIRTKMLSGSRIILLSFFLIYVTCVFAQFSGGSGTPEDPYLVATATDLSNVRNYLDYHFMQTANIDLGVAPYNVGIGWNPIGTWIYYEDPGNEPFTGTYSGDGYYISNLYINFSVSPTRALFGYTENAMLLDIELRSVNVTCNNRGAGLVAYNYLTPINRCTVTGTVSGTGNSLALMVAINDGSDITQCAAVGTVSGNADMAGALVGFNKYNCIISNSFSDGYVAGDEDVGGLVGYNLSQASIENSYSYADVSGRNYVGGLCGVSFSGSDITDCYTGGDVNGETNVGGLVGYVTTSDLTNCYATGQVTGLTTVGGLAGGHSSGTSTHSYWNTETTGQTSSALGEGRTSNEMIYPFDANTYVDWDFVNIWSFDPDLILNNGYPYLNNMTQVSSEDPIAPKPVVRLNSYPNPFNPITTLSFSLPKDSVVRLEIFNIRGQRIRLLSDEFIPKGEHSFIWNGTTDKGESVASGIYFCSLKGRGFQVTRKLTLMK